MTEKPGPEMLAAALRHAARGWRVFPCVERTKRPCDETGFFEHGCKSATKSPFWIKKYWGRWPTANPAVATGAESAVWVLDIDVKNGVNGFDTLGVLETLFGPAPTTLGQRTPTGGAQRFFVWPEGREVRNRNGKKLGPGLDVRGDGGYVMVPPSIHPDRLDGPRYRWDADPESQPAVPAPEWLLRYVIGDPEDLDWLRQQVDGKALPEWLAKRLKAAVPAAAPSSAVPDPHPRALPSDGIHPYARKAFDDEIVKVRAAPPGQRNETLNESAFVLGGFVGGGLLPHALVEQHLHAAIQSWAGVPPDKRDRDAKTLVRALMEGMASPRELPPQREPQNRPSPPRAARRPPVAGNDDVSAAGRAAQATAARLLWSQRVGLADTPAARFLGHYGYTAQAAGGWPMLGAVDLPTPVLPGAVEPPQREPCLIGALLRWSPDVALRRSAEAVFCQWLTPAGEAAQGMDPETGELVPLWRLVGDAVGAVLPLTPVPNADRLLLVVGLDAALRLKRACGDRRPLWMAASLSHAGHAVLPPSITDVTLVLPEDTPVEREQWAVQRLAAAGRAVRSVRQSWGQSFRAVRHG